MLRNGIAKTGDHRSFIDLGASPTAQEVDGDVEVGIKIAEVREFADIPAVAELAYKGNIVFIDCTSAASDKDEMRRISKELNGIAKDCNGDAVMMANRFIILSSGGMKIDRNRVRRRKTE